MSSTLLFFAPSLGISAVALGAVFFLGGIEALFIALLLSILEVTLSFDNAVVNARVLTRMTAVWQRRFLTWGILIAVFGTRILFPILIVSATVLTSPFIIAQLAFFEPLTYAHLLEDARYAIDSFGAAFLLMVALKYFMDASKERHWLRVIERTLSRWGRIESVELAIALTALVAISFAVPEEAMATVLVGGVIGVVLFLLSQGVASVFSLSTSQTASTGLALFVYLEILDSAFSLDSVIGAFALSSSIPVIAAGLGIGAFFVRSLTIFFVRHRTLESLVYLEHGAHWAILGLATSMLASLLFEIPELITGGIGLAFLVAAYYSSIIFNGKQRA